MANEAVCIETPTLFARYTVANGTAVPIGTVMYLSADHTALATSAADQSFIGISWEEKTASDGLTQLTLARNGVWDMKDSGAGSTRGTLLAVGGANLVVTADAADILNGALVGYADETASASEVIRVILTKFGASG